MTFEELYAVVAKRADENKSGSYTAELLANGIDRVAQKVGEEAVEVVIAAKNSDKQLLVAEIADLYYHLSVLMFAKGVTLNDVGVELGRRNEVR